MITIMTLVRMTVEITSERPTLLRTNSAFFNLTQYASSVSEKNWEKGK